MVAGGRFRCVGTRHSHEPRAQTTDVFSLISVQSGAVHCLMLSDRPHFGRVERDFSSARRSQNGSRARKAASRGAPPGHQGRHGHRHGSRGRALSRTRRADRALHCGFDESRPPGRAGFFRRGRTWKRLAGTSPLALGRSGDEAGLRGRRPEPSDGRVQESVSRSGT